MTRRARSLIFNQSQVLSLVVGVLFLVVAMAIRVPYANLLAADAVTAKLAADYLLWFVPAMALQFGLIAMGVGPARHRQLQARDDRADRDRDPQHRARAGVHLRMGHGRARMGVAGAALATLIAIVIGVVWMTTYFLSAQVVSALLGGDWSPRPKLWADMLKIGLPAGAEFALMAVYLMLVYVVSRPFGAAAQAGFGIGMRILQACFLPVVALGFAVGPVAGQNFGARKARSRQGRRSNRRRRWRRG